MTERTPIDRHGIRKGDTVRWERQGAELGSHPMRFDAVEYVARNDFHTHSARGQHYLLHRPEPRESVRFGWYDGRRAIYATGPSQVPAPMPDSYQMSWKLTTKQFLIVEGLSGEDALFTEYRSSDIGDSDINPDDFVEGVLVPKRQWDGMAARVDAGREWGSNSYDGGILTSAKALVAAARRMNGGEPDD